MGLFRQSKSRTSLALLTLFGVPCCPATVVNIQTQITDALTPCYEEIQAALPSAPVAHCDETPFKEGSSKAWLWTFVTATFTFFAVRLTRSASVPISLLGPDYAGVVITDRYSSYSTFNDNRQFCWAHLKRDFQGLIDAGGDGAVIGNRLMALMRQMFELWHRYRVGRIRHDTLRRKIEETIQGKFYNTLEEGQRCRHAPTVTLCNSLFNRFDQLWTFTTTPGVEPTNNRAEQSLRHAVIWRKLSFGTQSASGSRFVETPPHGRRNLPPTTPPHPRLPHRIPPSPPQLKTNSKTPQRGVNGYVHLDESKQVLLVETRLHDSQTHLPIPFTPDDDLETVLKKVVVMPSDEADYANVPGVEKHLVSFTRIALNAVIAMVYRADWHKLEPSYLDKKEQERLTTQGKSKDKVAVRIAKLRLGAMTEIYEFEQSTKAFRSHWSIENTCHWCLEITYREDESRIRAAKLRENCAWLNRF